MRNVITSGEMKKTDFNYLWISPEIPIDVIVVDKKRMKPEMVERLRDAFTGMSKTEEGRAILKASHWAEFQAAEDARFDPLRKILELKKQLAKKK